MKFKHQLCEIIIIASLIRCDTLNIIRVQAVERDGRVVSAFDSCLKDMGSNLAEAGHYVTTVCKLLTPTVPGEAEGWLNQLTPGIADTSVANPGKSFTCIGSGLLSLLSLIGG